MARPSLEALVVLSLFFFLFVSLIILASDTIRFFYYLSSRLAKHDI